MLAWVVAEIRQQRCATASPIGKVGAMFPLGHVSIQTTERYLGRTQKLRWRRTYLQSNVSFR
jgi:hypothetical protein